MIYRAIIWLVFLAPVFNQCINGEDNGEEFMIGTCKKCVCKGDKVTCKVVCRRTKEFIGRNPLTSSLQKLSDETHYSCMLENIVRKDNESWYEVGRHSSGLDLGKECMQCNCHKGIVTCTIRICPKLTCTNPVKKEGTCCFVCPEQKKSVREECMQSGSIFLPSSTWRLYIPIPDNHGHCLDCKCVKGKNEKWNHVCKRQNCPRSSCLNPFGTSGQCCRSCKDGEHPSSQKRNEEEKTRFTFDALSFLKFESGSNIKKKIPNELPPLNEIQGKNRNNRKISLPSKKTPDCMFDGNQYKHLESFIPTMDKCLRCHCENSNIRCSKVICINRLSCSKPERRPQLCCPVCAGTSTTLAQTLEEKNLVKIKNQKSDSCSNVPSDRIQVYEYRQSKGSFRAFSDKSFYLFDRSHRNEPSEMHTWVLNDKNVDVTITQLTDVKVPLTRWRLVGLIKDKILKRLYRHEEDMRKPSTSEESQRKMKALQKLINDKSRKRRLCKSSASVLPSDTAKDILRTLQEVG